ncbi:MAG: Rrf2 family transcriptional regulator [candidate division WOR-3 bacterium]|nr:MAG: Rrf2 family transcriptional regulator [candidate division WOR-3 bacterium]
MKVSSRFRYGLRLLVDLAANYKKGPVLLKEIARCEKISKKYLEQIVITLRAAGIISAIRGSKGGYFLTKSPNKIKILDVYKILEGQFAPVDCLDNKRICTLTETCPTRPLWTLLSDAIKKTFQNVTLADLLKDNKGNFPK